MRITALEDASEMRRMKQMSGDNQTMHDPMNTFDRATMWPEGVGSDTQNAGERGVGGGGGRGGRGELGKKTGAQTKTARWRRVEK